MERNWKSLLKKQSIVALAAMGIAGGSAITAPKAEAQISGVFGADWYSHFISYGYDVDGGGSDLTDKDRLNPYFELNWKLDDFNVFAGTWWDINDNNVSGIGGSLQEVDIWVGVNYTFEDVTVGATYQEWFFGGQVETIVDLSVSYDDSGMWGGDFALKPSFVAHRSDTTNGADDDGWAFVLSVEPGFTAVESDEFTLDLSFPVAIGYGDSDFYIESGLGFFTFGVAGSVPLTFIDSSYGDWAANAGLAFYHTPDDQTGNPDENFLVANVGVSVAF